MRRLAIITLVVILAGCGGAGSTSPGAPSGTPESEPGTAEQTEGRFRLSFTLPRTTWSTSESITGEASLALVGDGVAELSGSGGGLLAFAFRQVGGQIDVEPAWTADCTPHRLATGEPMTAPIAKSGGWSDDQPNADFYRAFFADPQIRLPAGDWEITAVTNFIEGRECQGANHAMEATVRVHITE